MKFLRIPIVFLMFVSAAALAADAPAPASVLPSEFGGWQASGAINKSVDATVVDSVNAVVLKEYGFERFEKADYVRTDGDGRKLAIKAAVFKDASGAYGAFTYYQTPAMLDEKIGAQAGSLNNRVLFFQGNVLVDALFDKLSVMSAAELRELAGMLPEVVGSAGKLPPLRMYLPTRGYQKNTMKYVLGPVTLDRLGAPLSSTVVDFKPDTEVVLAKYDATAGDSTLMLIEYPTPQIAAEKLRQIDAAHQVTPQQPGVASIVNVGPFFDKRSGPMVAIASGPLSQSEARTLLGSISYTADVTWNQNTFASKRDNLANLLFNVIVLCGIVVGLGLVAGVGFGGIRILLKRIFPGRVFDRAEAMEIISLHLGDKGPGGAERR
jgi:predicted membrane protein